MQSLFLGGGILLNTCRKKFGVCTGTYLCCVPLSRKLTFIYMRSTRNYTFCFQQCQAHASFGPHGLRVAIEDSARQPIDPTGMVYVEDDQQYNQKIFRGVTKKWALLKLSLVFGLLKGHPK